MPVTGAAARAASLGFDHIDISAAWEGDESALAIPVGDRMAYPNPRAGYSCPAPPHGDGMWDHAVAAYRRCPGMRVEPWTGSICDSVAAVRELLAAVPGLRLLVDTGHVAAWGEDPVELLDHADHVQLRQARRGETQVHPDDGGDVDFAAVVARLDQRGYTGLLSVEYFDLPEFGWPLDDPVAHATALAERLRPMLR
jgi:hypothetical protein